MASLGRFATSGDWAIRGRQPVEAAIVTPLLLLLTLAIVDFASMFYAYWSLEHGREPGHAARDYRRTMNDPDGNALNRQDSISRCGESTPTLTIPDSAFSFSFMAPGPLRGPAVSRSRRRPKSHGQLHVEFMTPMGAALLHGRQLNLIVQSR